MLILTNDEQVKEVIRKLKGNQIVPSNLELKFNYVKNTLLFTNQGVGELKQEDTFYDVLEENLYYIKEFILDRLMALLQCDFTLRIKVAEDGSIDRKNIDLETHIYIYESIIDKQGFIYEKLQVILPLYPFVTKVHFRRNEYEIKNVNLFLNIDSSKFNNCFKNAPNRSILSQWVSTYMQVKRHITNKEYNYTYEINVTNGRMHFASRNDGISLKFTQKYGKK